MNLAVLMAGQGSRFLSAGIEIPKPLVMFCQRPLFWWAVQSALSSNSFNTLYFGVLKQHIKEFSIDKRIYEYYPDAKIFTIDNVTSGAATTAAIIASQINSKKPIAFLDCDLAFSFACKDPFAPFFLGDAKGALCLFNSNNSSYSFVNFDEDGKIIGTVEKIRSSQKAIAGCYLFSSVSEFINYFNSYQKSCPYEEFYMSGIFNLMLKDGCSIKGIDLKHHISLGTPEDIRVLNAQCLDSLDWFSNA